MDTQLLSRLNRLTGSLKPSAETSLNDLNKLNRKLAEELIKNPDLNISGHLPHHEGAEGEATINLSERFRHLSDLFERKEASTVESSEPAPLVFRRETAFRNNFLGNSVPSWGTGMEVSQSFGPFINEYGLPVWFDFFFAIKTVKVFIQGETLPALLIPVRGIITARDSYRIEAGSIWIASHLIAKTPVLKGFYTGLKIEGGSLNLSANPIINSGNIIIHPAITADLQIQHRQNPSPAPSPDAGFDAQASVIELPKTLGIKFNAANSSITASDASCIVFGTEAIFGFANLAPVFIDFLSQILIPYTVSSNSDDPANFNIQSSLSKLCTFDKAAGFDINSGWLLPAAKIDPSLLGEAAGTGSLCIGLKKGINAIWKGLKGGRTKFNHPAIIAEPGMLTVIDFFTENNYGKQKWELWQNAGSKHHSEISIGFEKLFPFVFISSSKGTETILYFCNHKASFDRPVDANGSPFKIESTVALGSIVQTGKTFLASLFDNDLLFDGNFNKPEAYKKNSIALRNALFTVTSPYSLFLTGELENDNKIIKGSIALSFGIHQYLPTLPDPYVASFTIQVRGQRAASSNLQLALVAFVKWPNKGEAPNPEDGVNDWAYLYFRFAPLNFPLATARASLVNTDTGLRRTDRDFRTGVATFNSNIAATSFVDKSSFSINSLTHEPEVKSLQSTVNQNLSDTVSRSVHSGEITEAIAGLDANPLLRSINDKANKVSQVLDAALQNNTRSVLTGFSDNAMMMNNPANMDSNSFAVSDNRGLLYARDNFMLLDVSTNADLMGVSFGTSFDVDRDDQGNTRLTKLNVFTTDTANANAFPLQILNMDVVAEGRNVRAVTLPQISWEPVTNIPLEIEGKVDPLDTITVTPGLLVYDNDGIPTRIFSESPYQVPITPLSVTHHFLKEYNDKKIPRQLHSVFTLPFAIIAQAAFQRNINEPENKNARLHFNMPWFDQSRGGLQIKVEAPDVEDKNKESLKPSFPGWTLQLEHNIKWFLFGIPVTGSTLGNTVKLVFNEQFSDKQPEVPLERMEISGYGASIFSDWFDKKAAIAKVSQAKFDVIVGRTGSEVIQIRSIMYPYAVHVVRTITLTRSPNGYVFRSDSGWKAESDGFFDFDYTINFKKTFPDRFVDNPYNIHNEVVKGVSNVREIRDYPDGGLFTSSFTINDPGLPPIVSDPVIGLTLPEWQSLFNGIAAGGKLDVKMQAVVFDADVHMRDITSGGVFDSASGDYKVQSRKMLGYVQLSPSSILVPGHVFADLLKFQNGSLGGSVDSIMNIALSKQRMRITRVDVNPAFDAAGKPVFVSAARGSLLLPQDGSWSVVKQHTDSGDIKPLEDGQTVPLIKTNGSGNYRIANPADILVSTSSKINYGVLQSTGTQKLLFDIPQFKNGVEKLLSNQTYFADAYKLLNSKGPFPNIVNALQLTNAEKEVAILGEGLMKMADRDINVASLLPANYQYVFIEEPDILKVYAEYKGTGGDNGNLKLGIDSTAAHADKWKAALSNVRIVVDLGPIQELVWVDGNFNASNGISSKFDKPNLQFGPVLQPVVDILRVLAMLTGDDFDEGMKVGMSNSPDNWEYKFDCSKEIPVIKFPSPLQLSINPNPPLKLEAGLKVGFYFNQMLSIPTDIKQLVPACGAYVEFYGRMQVQCFTLGVASIYAVGQVVLGMAADTKAGKILYMKVGFGVELVVGLPVVANVTVLYMVEVEVKLGETSLTIGALMLFRGSAEICGGLVGICIQIEAGGSIERDLGGTDRTNCIAQVTFSIDVCVLWVIDINFTDHWEETRQIS